MGGGYRLKSTESCRDAIDSMHIGSPHRARPTSRPRASLEGERSSTYRAAHDTNRHHPIRSSNQSQVNSAEQLRREQEAEIEREYIHNLQKQVYFLELELESFKQLQPALPTREAVHCGAEHGSVDEVVEGLKAKLSDAEQR